MNKFATVGLLLVVFIAFTMFGIPDKLQKLKPGFYLPPQSEKYTPEGKVYGHNILKHVRMNGIDYAIPNGYLKKPIPAYTEDVIAIIAVTPENFDMFIQKTKGNPLNDTHRILAHTLVHRRTIDDFARKMTKYNPGQTAVRVEYGLILLSSEEYRRDYREQHFINRENGKIATFIRCVDAFTPQGMAVCNHHFSDDKLKYEVIYTRDSGFRNWRLIEQKTKKLFSQFQADAEQLKLSKITIPEERINPLVKEYATNKMLD